MQAPTDNDTKQGRLALKDLSEFEPGLAPSDPWDLPATIEDELQQLQTSQSQKSSIAVNNAAVKFNHNTTQPTKNKAVDLPHDISRPLGKVGALREFGNSERNASNETINTGRRLFGENDSNVSAFCREKTRLISEGFRESDIDAVYSHWLENEKQKYPATHKKFAAHLNALAKLRELGFSHEQYWQVLIDTDPDKSNNNTTGTYENWGESAINRLLSQ